MPGETNPSVSERLTLFSVFAQGLHVTESLISEGQYVKASASLKQDFEILTRTREVNAGTAQERRTPNVKHAPKGSQHFYGDLNELAHPSNLPLLQVVMRQLHEGEVHGISSIPTFHAETARSMYELHVWLLFEMAREMIRLAIEMYGESNEGIRESMGWLVTVTGVLEAAGLRVSDPTTPL